MYIITPLHTPSTPLPSYFIFRCACKPTNLVKHNSPQPCIYTAQSSGETDIITPTDLDVTFYWWSASSRPFMLLGISLYIYSAILLSGNFPFFPFSSTLWHLPPHPSSEVMLLPISLKEWKRISIRLLIPHASTCQHLWWHPLPSTMPYLGPRSHVLLPTQWLFWQVLPLSPTASMFIIFNMSKTELLIFHCK